MGRGAKGKSSISVGLAAVDLIGRIFGHGNRRRCRNKSGTWSSFEGYSRLHDRNCVGSPGCAKCMENLERSDYGDEEDELTLLESSPPRFKYSSDDEYLKRRKSADHSCLRRRKGFSCMRLRIVSMGRMMAMMRKVRLAYRRMMNAAVASKTILCFADLYNDISDLIPVPCGKNEARTIVIIRPINCATGPSRPEGEALPSAPSSHVSSTKAGATRDFYVVHRRYASHDSGDDTMLVEGPVEVVTEHLPSSRWHKFAFRSFSCVCAPSATSSSKRRF